MAEAYIVAAARNRGAAREDASPAGIRRISPLRAMDSLIERSGALPTRSKRDHGAA